MKYLVFFLFPEDSNVAPSMGAWIEITPLRRLWLTAPVAPSMGAWIEMKKIMLDLCGYIVAPSMGAWIEIISDWEKDKCKPSLPLWERGLK